MLFRSEVALSAQTAEAPTLLPGLFPTAPSARFCLSFSQPLWTLARPRSDGGISAGIRPPPPGPELTCLPLATCTPSRQLRGHRERNSSRGVLNQPCRPQLPAASEKGPTRIAGGRWAVRVAMAACRVGGTARVARGDSRRAGLSAPFGARGPLGEEVQAGQDRKSVV